MDKKLILGVMDQHVELVEERLASQITGHLTQQPVSVGSDSGSASGDPNNGYSIQHLAEKNIAEGELDETKPAQQ